MTVAEDPNLAALPVPARQETRSIVDEFCSARVSGTKGSSSSQGC